MSNHPDSSSSYHPRYVNELPNEQEERLEKLFKKLDVDGDGRISYNELVDALGKMQIPYMPGNVQKFIEKSDVAKSGYVDFAEFLRYSVEHEKQLMVVFKTLDENRDGILDANEIMHAFSKLGIKINKQTAMTLLKRMDKDGSFTITFDEWRDYLMFHPSSEIRDIFHFWRHATFVDIGEDTLVPDDFTENEMKSGMWWRHLVAGGVAGAVSRTCTAPLDRLKVFLQVKGSEFSSMTACFKFMIKEGSILSLWRGNGVNVIKIAPESAIKFMSYEQIKKILRGNTEREMAIYERLVAGSLAGGISQTAIYPMEVLKTRLALRTTGQYSSMWDAAKKIYRKEGIRCFYRGYIPNLIGIIPYAGIDLGTYESLKNSYLRRHGVDHPGMLVLLGCGAISSTCGQIASYPLALIRTRLQAQESSRDGMMDIFRRIVKKEGFFGLYRGITPNFLKVAPAVGISYAVYENARQSLGGTMT